MLFQPSKTTTTTTATTKDQLETCVDDENDLSTTYASYAMFPHPSFGFHYDFLAKTVLVFLATLKVGAETGHTQTQTQTLLVGLD